MQIQALGKTIKNGAEYVGASIKNAPKNLGILKGGVDAYVTSRINADSEGLLKVARN